MNRKPAVAGSFYSDIPKILEAELVDYLAGGTHDLVARGIVVPHAGYIYSGQVAAEAFKAVKIPRTVVLLGPNHHGLGAHAAVFAAGCWTTPLGEVPVNEDLARKLIENCVLLEADELAHRHEHSIEVQIPFLQSSRADLQIVPISLGHGDLDDWLSLGRQIGATLLESGMSVLLVASSDMNHFESAAYTERVDHQAIEQMEAFDPVGLYNLVRTNNISMCGVIPTVVMLEATRILGATGCRLLKYDHSGSINGDLQSVVGYASLVVE